MDNQQHHSSNHFFHGFILGAIVGAAVIFFLFTDKGKKLLKIITEEGLEGVSEIRDMIEAEDEESSFAKASEDKDASDGGEPILKTSPKSPKKFFRGIKRK